ncbi:MAG: TIGR03761 family integrating conjugative element protein [Thiobacillaceae bacterium]
MGTQNKGNTPLYPTSSTSPFEDSYDIEGEREALKDLLAAENPDETDLRWPRFVELKQREEQLRQMRTVYEVRQGADRLVNDREARGVSDMGGLVDEGQDTMMIHTKEAYRLFLGRGRDPDRLLQPIIGGRRVAASLRAVWYLSGNDNPYADWALIDMTSRLDDARKKLDTLCRDCEAKLDEMRKRGLNISVLRNRVPKEVELGFKSPYGYTVAEHIITYDHFVRLAKTLVRKDLMSDDEGRQTVREITRLYRSIFETPTRFERYLMREELRPLSRSDFLPGATAEALKRVRAVVGIFGEVPREIFTGALVPRHSKRWVSLTPQEIRLLQEVALAPEPEPTPGDEEGLI